MEAWKDLEEKVETLQDICENAKHAIEQNQEAANICAKENKQLQKQQAFLQEGHSLQSDYRSAFTFRKENRRQLVELDGFEKVSKEIHTHYQRELGVVSGSENKKEILGAIRENSKLMFKTRFIKNILGKKTGSAGTQGNGRSSERSNLRIAGVAAFN